MRASCYGQHEKYDCWGDRRKLVAGAQCPRALDAAVRRGPFIECGYELRLGGTQTPILSVFEIFERLPETNDVCLSDSGGKHPDEVSRPYGANPRVPSGVRADIVQNDRDWIELSRASKPAKDF